jgi:hypothetical protein
MGNWLMRSLVLGMIRGLIVLSIVLAATSAQAQGPRVTHSADCTKSKIPCNGPPHRTVLDGLEQPDGTAARYHAELCRVVPSADQEACMAQWPAEPKRVRELPELRSPPATAQAVAPGVETPTAESSSPCDFQGPQSLGTIQSALKGCAVVTVNIDGLPLRYTNPTLHAPVSTPTSQAAMPNEADVKAKVATMLRDSEIAQFGKIYTKVTNGVHAVCGQVSGRDGYGSVRDGMRFVAVNGVVHLIAGGEGDAAGREALYTYCGKSP